MIKTKTQREAQYADTEEISSTQEAYDFNDENCDISGTYETYKRTNECFSKEIIDLKRKIYRFKIISITQTVLNALLLLFCLLSVFSDSFKLRKDTEKATICPTLTCNGSNETTETSSDKWTSEQCSANGFEYFKNCDPSSLTPEVPLVSKNCAFH